MSRAAPSAPLANGGSDAGGAAAAPVGDSCPLCGAPLDPEQQWCLRCGAAARTRLAASPRWRAPIIALAVVAALSLAVLAASLIKLAGGSSTPATRVATTVTAPGFVTSPGTATLPPPTPTATAPPSAAPPTTGVPSGTLSKRPTVTPPTGAVPTELVIKNLIAGSGAAAKPGDTLTVNYLGVLFHGGQEFGSSWQRGKRFTFTLGKAQLIPGWETGVQGMRVGERRELIIPAALAYGVTGLASTVPIPPNAALVLVVDLRELNHGRGVNFPFYGEVSTGAAPATGAPLRARPGR